MNKNVTECKACGGRVSRKAKTCPHCGQKKPARSIKFSERSKPMQVLMIIGGGFWMLIFMAAAIAPERPKTPETPEEIRKKEANRMIADIRTECNFAVKKHLKVKKSAKIPLFQGQILPMDEYGLKYKYLNTVEAQNAYGVFLENPFECHASYQDGQATASYLKIGKNVYIK